MVWVPDIRFTSCDLRVLMDQSTEANSSHDPPRRPHDNGQAGPKWRRLPQGAVRAMAVGMVGVVGQHRPQLPAATISIRSHSSRRTLPTHHSA
jgi:hypothetical protein